MLQNLGRMKEFDVDKWVNDSYIRKAYRRAGPGLRRPARELRQLRGQGRGQVLQEADRRSAQGRRSLGRRRRRSCRSAAPPARSAPTPTSRPRARRSTSPTSSTPRAASSCSPTRPSIAVAGKGEIAPFLLKKDAEAYAAKIGGKVLGFEEALKVGDQRRLNAWSVPPSSSTTRSRSMLGERGVPRRVDGDGAAAAARSARCHRALAYGCIADRSAGAADRRPLARAVPAVWHLLTKYRVNILRPFPQRPVAGSGAREPVARVRAIRNSSTTSLLSCRRILFGFLLATVVAVPLGLLMGRFRLMRELVFPVTEVLRPIPAIAWVPMSIMLWPSNEESIVFITFLGSFFPDPAQHAARHGDGRSGTGARRAVPRRARSRRSFARSISLPRCRTSSPG